MHFEEVESDALLCTIQEEELMAQGCQGLWLKAKQRLVHYSLFLKEVESDALLSSIEEGDCSAALSMYASEEVEPDALGLKAKA